MAQEEGHTAVTPGSARPPGGQPDPPASPWRTRGARVAYRTPWITVSEYTVMRPDGSSGIYSVVDPGDNVAVVALDASERIWLVGEFVYPLQRFGWMVPSGKREGDEAAEAAAQRELAEELGIVADNWQALGTYDLSCGISAQATHLFLARGLTRGMPQPEGTEVLRARQVALDEAYGACLRGEIRDAPSVLGIWRAHALLRGGG